MWGTCPEWRNWQRARLLTGRLGVRVSPREHFFCALIRSLIDQRFIEKLAVAGFSIAFACTLHLRTKQKWRYRESSPGQTDHNRLC